MPRDDRTIKLAVRKSTPFREIWETMARQHRTRSVLGFTLMVAQAFFYNAILFTYGLVLLRYYNVRAEKLGLFLVPLALGNFVGPLIIGRFFDTVGRKPIIAITYIGSGALLAITAFLFRAGVPIATTQAACWSVIFFVASSAARSLCWAAPCINSKCPKPKRMPSSRIGNKPRPHRQTDRCR